MCRMPVARSRWHRKSSIDALMRLAHRSDMHARKLVGHVWSLPLVAHAFFSLSLAFIAFWTGVDGFNEYLRHCFSSVRCKLHQTNQITLMWHANEIPIKWLYLKWSRCHRLINHSWTWQINKCNSLASYQTICIVNSLSVCVCCIASPSQWPQLNGKRKFDRHQKKRTQTHTVKFQIFSLQIFA